MYRKRKSDKKFKYRRGKLHGQKSAQALRKEAKEGTTYGNSLGLNLDPRIQQPAPKSLIDLDRLMKNISVSELVKYEKLVPPYSKKPNQLTLSYDPSKFYKFVVLIQRQPLPEKMQSFVSCQLLMKRELKFSLSTFCH